MLQKCLHIIPIHAPFGPHQELEEVVTLRNEDHKEMVQDMVRIYITTTFGLWCIY